jgi:hypothetical protein
MRHEHFHKSFLLKHALFACFEGVFELSAGHGFGGDEVVDELVAFVF